MKDEGWRKDERCWMFIIKRSDDEQSNFAAKIKNLDKGKKAIEKKIFK